MFKYVYTAAWIKKPRRYAVINHHDDADSPEPFVVLEALDSSEALERAVRIAPTVRVKRDTKEFWQVVEHAGPAPSMCPQFADEFFAFLDSLQARRDSQLH